MTVEQAILETLKVLPPEKQELLAFAESLVQKAETEGVEAQADWQDDPFAGMWKDREEIKDSGDWVRQLCHQQWQRS